MPLLKVTPEVEEIIVSYYKLGYNAKRIHALLERQGISLSYSYLRCKVLPRLGLCIRGRHRASENSITTAMAGILPDPQRANLSSQHMQATLRAEYGIYTSRKTVLRGLRQLQPNMVDARRKTVLCMQQKQPNIEQHRKRVVKRQPQPDLVDTCRTDGIRKKALNMQPQPPDMVDTRRTSGIRKTVFDIQNRPNMLDACRPGPPVRRTYTSLGPNDKWHIDGYEKLTPFGLPIHGCIDGFSRMLLWLELAPSNRDPEQTCQYYMKAVEQYGVPHTVKVDKGPDNYNIVWAQRYLSADLPRLTEVGAVEEGSSYQNERITRFWGQLSMQHLKFWIDHFEDFVSDGFMIEWDSIDSHICYYTYHHLVLQTLERILRFHNHHRIRSQQNRDIVTGVPAMLFSLPEKHGDFQDCGRPAAAIKVAVVRHRLTGSATFDENFQLVLDDLVNKGKMLYPPTDIKSADAMYLTLRAQVRHQLSCMTSDL